MNWVAVVPVKGTPEAKSRLGDLPDRGGLADAFALDTVAALLESPLIREVFVVTADGALATRLAGLGAVIVPELRRDPTDPLNAAIRQGVDAARAARPECGIAVLTGDLPALTASDVQAALGLAAEHPLSMVADEEGTGTTALLALGGVPFSPRFGVGSRAAHQAAGHVPLGLPPTASIRRDVDTVDNLAEALHHGVGVHTSALVASASGAPGLPAGPQR
ncbi:2-phospho-L-lactate guanylyltransferase [Cryobacterium tagatosivorans]|uniref:Phosphoenolpyruvate guanylyltransferase n=1 Tax=Cryobacterium tagatosivorans TaxID=1259199 RepID=A0A4R8UBZ8_9MICO|nr:2-phospho-L-lactate guanylyltransferase [Cryobacterium tagatosivorans]TFB47560.1 2-phospho-L-lactate guanylyltransferase [Cryobacterium tagatosivorans]